MVVDIKKTVARNIRTLRHSRSLSSDEFAAALGFSQSGVSDWEMGKKMPRPDSLQKIAGYFHVTVPELLADTSPAARAKAPADEIIDLGALLIDPSVRVAYEGRIFGQKEKLMVRRLIEAAITNA
ncbi:MAG: helix-turn-helix domain-containing protein [Clostridiales Family XIII bacterium]|nr:helix-turn-helix domain-containing protein [Clostridiales Family XIII bacterium]